MKTPEEWNAIKNEVEALSWKPAELTGTELEQVTGGGAAANDLRDEVESKFDYLKRTVGYLSDDMPNKTRIVNHVSLCQYYIDAGQWSDVKYTCSTISALANAFADTSEGFSIRYFANEIVTLLKGY